jgi:AcrR family transcriptional regulator
MSAEERKRAIIKAALPLFARRGFAATTTRELAKAAGVSEPLLYKHFPGKEALYDEIHNFSCREANPVVEKLKGLEASTSTLVHLIYYLTSVIVAGRPAGAIPLDTYHRLMVNSLLEDGAFARLLYQNRFDCFCARMEACLKAAIAAGDAVKGPISKGNHARFAHHLAAWLASVHLPRKPVVDYGVSREELRNQVVWFALRGMGLTDKAIGAYYNPRALALFFKEN